MNTRLEKDAPQLGHCSTLACLPKRKDPFSALYFFSILALLAPSLVLLLVAAHLFQTFLLLADLLQLLIPLADSLQLLLLDHLIPQLDHESQNSLL